MTPCDLECGQCEHCVDYLTAKADDQRNDWAIEDTKLERDND